MAAGSGADMLRFGVILTALLALSAEAWAQQAPPPDRPGDAYELNLRIRTESQSTNGSSGKSNSGGALIERVVALHPDGLELEFDLPPDTTPEERAREWQWPARVLWSENAPPRLLNGAEMEQRLDVWLKAGEIPREACGRWFFSWTAFKIECDPNAVLETLKVYDLRSGAGPADPAGEPVVIETDVDPEEVRREKAEADVVVAEITGGEPLTFEQALAARASDQISGIETLVREVDSHSRPIQQVRTIRLEITTADGIVEQSTSTQTLTRTPVQAPH